MIDAKLIKKKNESVVSVQFDDGKESCYHGIWLRDHCKCPNCYHPLTKQRLLDTTEILVDIEPKTIAVKENVLHIKWPDGHQSSFQSNWLHHNSYNPNIKLVEKKYTLWGKELINNLPTVLYADVMNEEGDGLKRWLNNLVFYNLY
jgi:trimethyllysine dioxygenase